MKLNYTSNNLDFINSKTPSKILYYVRIIKLNLNSDRCIHWACNKADNTCVGCGAVICPTCLKEPKKCKCENKDICCK